MAPFCHSKTNGDHHFSIDRQTKVHIPFACSITVMVNVNTTVRHLLVLLVIISSLSLQSSQTSVSSNQYQIARKLSPLRTYKDAQVFRFQIPDEVRIAMFRFNASQSDTQPSNVNSSLTISQAPSILARPTSEPPTVSPPNQTSTAKPSLFNTTLVTVYVNKLIKFYRSFLSSACKKPLNVTFYLRWGALPLLSIKNATTPDNYIFNNTLEQYRVDLKTDGQTVLFNLTNPLPGDWYGLAYINQVNDKIAQKGLEQECFYHLVSSLSLDQSLTGAHKEAAVLPASASYSLRQSLVIDHQDSQPELLYKFSPNGKEYGAKIVLTNCQFWPSTNVRHHLQQQQQQEQHQQQPRPFLSSVESSSLYNKNEQSNTNAQPWSNGSCPIQVNFRTLALPSSSQHDFTFNCLSNHSMGSVEVNNGKCIIELPTYAPNQWNYLQVIPLQAEHQHQQQTRSELRTKLQYGSINFTIQLLMGQEAFLYNYYNDQQCALPTTVPLTSTTHNALGYPNNFGFNQKEANVYNIYLTTAASNIVAPPKPNPVSQIKTEIAGANHNNINSGLSVDEFETNPNTHPPPLQHSNNVSVTVPPETSVTLDRGHLADSRQDDSIDEYAEDDDVEDESEAELSKSSLSQFTKRSADPPGPGQGQGQGRKKGDRKPTKEERRLKKLKNKQNRQKNKEAQEKMNTADQCQFDPVKILNSLDEEEMANRSAVNAVNLTRYQSGELFEFKYSPLDVTTLLASQNFSESVLVEVDNERPSLANFTIMPQFDIGGNLEIVFAISPHTPNHQQNVSAILCLTHNRLPPIVSSASGIRFDEFCYGHLVSNTSVANYTTEGSPIRTLVVPYPQTGTWYVSILVRCYNDYDTLEDPLLANLDYSGYSCESSNKTVVLLEIRSSSCHNSHCLHGGKCLQYLNGGILYSTCTCKAGWKGWICNDDSEALSPQKLLTNFLLLTVSNAAFIPAIIVAACRRYFTESVVYLITMTSSALYHACDSDYPQSVCVLSINLLQFADFYTAILSFFVTLITLANLSARFKSFLHLMGAIAIALITQNDRTNLWTFVVPAGLATLLLFTCWCSHCCRRSCYPPTRCWIFSVCPALILTVAGLVIYAFFETQDNYAITHSIWHGIVALALLFAIPSMPSTSNTGENEEEDDERVHFMSSSSSSGAGSGKGSNVGIQNAKMAHVEWRPPHTSFKFLHEDIDML